MRRWLACTKKKHLICAVCRQPLMDGFISNGMIYRQTPEMLIIIMLPIKP
jgi:hypothetical protein